MILVCEKFVICLFSSSFDFAFIYLGLTIDLNYSHKEDKSIQFCPKSELEITSCLILMETIIT